MPTPSAHPDTDVLITGHGPAGRMLGTLLALRGWLITVVDSSTSFEGGLDVETMRALGLEFEPRLPNLTVLRGHEATMLVDRGEHADAVVNGAVITSSWAVGTGGEHSFHDSARRWRSGRILLADGGVRDATNLAWKLDLVLRDRADDAVLDSYAVEKRSHDRLSAGIVHPTGGQLFDGLLGYGFTLLTLDPPDRVLTDRTRTFLRSIDAQIVHVPFLAADGRMALVRPDHYVFGTARDAYDLAELVDELRSQLFRKRFRPRPIE